MLVNAFCRDGYFPLHNGWVLPDAALAVDLSSWVTRKETPGLPEKFEAGGSQAGLVLSPGARECPLSSCQSLGREKCSGSFPLSTHSAILGEGCLSADLRCRSAPDLYCLCGPASATARLSPRPVAEVAWVSAFPLRLPMG